MTRFSALFLAAPLALAAPLPAQAQTGLAQVQAHLRAVQTMTANFTQTDSRGRSLSGTLTIKRPGRIRFDYGRAANMLIVGDGRALTFLDYSVGQQQRWPINDSPLSVFLNPNQDLSRFARVTQDDPRTLQVHGPRSPAARVRHDHDPLLQVRGRPRRADPSRLEHGGRAEQPDDGQPVRAALQRARRRQRVPLPADPAARTPSLGGSRRYIRRQKGRKKVLIRSSTRQVASPNIQAASAAVRARFSPCCLVGLRN